MRNINSKFSIVEDLLDRALKSAGLQPEPNSTKFLHNEKDSVSKDNNSSKYSPSPRNSKGVEYAKRPDPLSFGETPHFGKPEYPIFKRSNTPT